MKIANVSKKTIKSCVQVAPPVHINNNVVVTPPSGYHTCTFKVLLHIGNNCVCSTQKLYKYLTHNNGATVPDSQSGGPVDEFMCIALHFFAD